MKYPLYTIGYQGAALQDVLRVLLYHDVQALLDIRERAQSRKPGFSKTALGNEAGAVGIAYAHLRELGTPRDVRYRRKIDHDQVAFRDGYLAHLATQDDAMHALIARAERERCCLLCFEANAEECHRWLVAERANEMTGGAFEVIHLQPHMPTEPA